MAEPKPQSLDDLRDRLVPNHLVPDTTDEAKEQAEKSLDPMSEEEQESLKDAADPRMAKEYTFNFEWKDGRGKTWRGKFTNRILNIHQRQLVGILRARLSSNTPPDALDVVTNNINDMIAHLTYSLVKKPKWANNLLELTDVALLQAVMKEVLDHEDFFHGYESPEEASDDESEDGDGKAA